MRDAFNTGRQCRLQLKNVLREQSKKTLFKNHKNFFSKEPFPSQSQPMWLLGVSPSSDCQSNPEGCTAVLASDPVRLYISLHKDSRRLQQGSGERDEPPVLSNLQHNPGAHHVLQPIWVPWIEMTTSPLSLSQVS